jgi:hypothetical protein
MRLDHTPWRNRESIMKRTHIVATDLLIVAMALAFVALAAPAAAATPCLGLGEYYTFARECTVAQGADIGWLPLLMLQVALFGSMLGLVSLRRFVLRRDWAMGRKQA